MGEVGKAKYICKICSKSCVSGKSLGGHMRVHLALISASRKRKIEIKMEFEESNHQSNSAAEGEDEIKDCTDFGDRDQSNSYDLRENRRKSWRLSDSKHAVNKIEASCKECGKEFPTLRALSGHMRCHSMRNRDGHKCKECGKGFSSLRAMFGHMKCHSKKPSKVSCDTGDSFSDFCPIRRKRSRIRYGNTPKPSVSSTSVASEIEEVADCLVLLSRGVARDNIRLSTSSDDGSVYFGAESSSKSKNSNECDVDSMKLNRGLITMNLSNCISCSANALAEKDVSEFDEIISTLASVYHEMEQPCVVETNESDVSRNEACSDLDNKIA